MYDHDRSVLDDYGCRILYEDNHIIAALKPAGILSQSDGSGKPDMLTLIKDHIRIKYEKKGNVFLGLVHRLDLPVSGVMVFARTSKAASRLSAQIRERRFVKKYLAVVYGRMTPQSGELRNRLLKDERNIVREDISGKDAILRYDQLAYDPSTGNSLVDIMLETGRSHQIRVQFALAGHPLIGDLKYGRTDGRHHSHISEPALFAYLAGFEHPVTGVHLEIRAYPDNKIFTDGFGDLSELADKDGERSNR